MTTRSTPPRRHPIAPGLLLLAGFVLCCGTASAGPLHDPWLERFQVGTWLDPDTIPLAAGVPAGLLEPARIESMATCSPKVADEQATFMSKA